MMDNYREDFLNLALSSGAKLTGKPDGSEAIEVHFTIEAWRKFDVATAASWPVAEDCKWSYDPDASWDTSCGEKWVFIEGGPADNNVRFCHGCGKKVVVTQENE